MVPLAQAGVLSWWMSNNNDAQAYGGEVPVAEGANSADIDIPRLSGGEQYLHMQVKNGLGEVFDWKSALLTVTAETAVESLELTRAEGEAPYYFRGESIRGRIRLAGPDRPGRQLRVVLDDGQGNLWAQQENGAEEGGTEYAFALDSTHTVRLLNRRTVE